VVGRQRNLAPFGAGRQADLDVGAAGPQRADAVAAGLRASQRVDGDVRAPVGQRPDLAGDVLDRRGVDGRVGADLFGQRQRRLADVEGTVVGGARLTATDPGRAV
jgi:hypothetical protein